MPLCLYTPLLALCLKNACRLSKRLQFFHFWLFHTETEFAGFCELLVQQQISELPSYLHSRQTIVDWQ